MQLLPDERSSAIVSRLADSPREIVPLSLSLAREFVPRLRITMIFKDTDEKGGARRDVHFFLFRSGCLRALIGKKMLFGVEYFIRKMRKPPLIG